MRKALLTGTAAIALGMFGFGISGAHAASISVGAGCNLAACIQHNLGGANAQGTSNTSVNANGDLNGNESHDLNGNTVAGNGNSGRSATAIGGDATSNTQENSGRSATVNGDGLANSNSGNENFGAQGLLFGSAQVGNGVLAQVDSNNHVHVDVTLASAHAGGSLTGHVTNDNQSSAPFASNHDHYFGFFDNGSDVSNTSFGSVGVVTQAANGNGMQQVNTSVAVGAVNSGATLVSR